MAEQLTALILDESKWLSFAMLVSGLAVVVLLVRHGVPGMSGRLKNLQALNLFSGCMVGTMSSGHLLAVTIKLALGTLGGSVLILYPIGIVLAVPAWWIAFGTGHYAREIHRYRKRMLILNGWLVLSLLALGLNNWPLAIPSALGVAYQVHSRPFVGKIIVAVAVVSMLALFVGSVVFFVSGETFEQFEGMQ
jgi:hypothetical protein